MARKVLAFRHEPLEHLGRISDSLSSRGIACEYADLYAGVSVPDIETVDGLLIMGGPMSANDDLPYLRQELDLIRRAISIGKPILGVCLGAQLIAKALGARVYANRAKEIGWHPVSWTAAAAEDRVLGGLSCPETIFHLHSETFDLPAGADLLAFSDLCRNQAYRVGANIYGLQFHLEVTPEMILDWLTQDANCGELREVTASIDPHAHAARLESLAAQVFGGWLSLV